jgi:hypothetical protein
LFSNEDVNIDIARLKSKFCGPGALRQSRGTRDDEFAIRHRPIYQLRYTPLGPASFAECYARHTVPNIQKERILESLMILMIIYETHETL